MELQLYKEAAFKTIKFLPLHGKSDNIVYREKRDEERSPVKQLEYHEKYLAWGREHYTDQDIMHMLVGFNSEIHELYEAIHKQDEIGIGEELADIMWYTAGYATFRKISISSQLDVGYYTITELVRTLSKLTSLAKRYCVYGKNLSESQLQEEQQLVQKIVEICYNFEWKFNHPKVNLPKALANNISKLKIRYPNFYSDYHAADENRKLDEERKQLEK